MNIVKFLKDWALILSMLSGVAAYFLYINLPWFRGTEAFAHQAVAIAQPALIFCMLFLTFCRVDWRDLKFCRWHAWLLLIQCGLFTAIGSVLIFLPHSGMRVVLEGAMLCLICPTATAAAVITNKLEGDVAHVTTYTIMINLAVAIIIPIMMPLVHPQPGMSTLNSALLILAKVFPLLMLPLVLALACRHFFPRVHRWLLRWPDAAFYLWIVALALAIAVTTRSIVHCELPLSTQMWLVVVSILACALQFWAGRKIGHVYGDKVTAGQALGQKNTALAIWIGYTFFTPITAIVGGFYSIWHNLVNSYQLYHHRKIKQHENIDKDAVDDSGVTFPGGLRRK